MKKYLLGSAVLFTLVAFSGTAIAAGYGDSGCGPGSLVMGKKRDGGQLLAATTNGMGYGSSKGNDLINKRIEAPSGVGNI